MAVRILDLQLIYGVSGAREHFERLCANLIRSKFPDGKGVRVHQGDGGVDAYVGNWADSGGIHVFQVKFFPTGLGDYQKKQVRESFKTCLANQRFVTTKWTLCLPVDLTKDEIPWFNKWKQENATDTLTSDNIDYWGETELEALLFKPENRGIKEAFFKEEYLTQIREMHGMLATMRKPILSPIEPIEISLAADFGNFDLSTGGHSRISIVNSGLGIADTVRAVLCNLRTAACYAALAPIPPNETVKLHFIGIASPGSFTEIKGHQLVPQDRNSIFLSITCKDIDGKTSFFLYSFTGFFATPASWKLEAFETDVGKGLNEDEIQMHVSNPRLGHPRGTYNIKDW